MPIPTDPSVSTPRSQLRNLVDEWKSLDEWIKRRADDPRADQATDTSDFTRNKEKRRELRIQIMDLVEEHPNLARVADGLGFTYSGLDVPGDVSGSGGADAAAQSQRNGADSDAGGANRPGDGGTGGTSPAGGTGAGTVVRGAGSGGQGNDIDHLPGTLGKDYHFVKGPNGVVHVVYDMDVPGRADGNVTFTVPKEFYDRYGIDPDKVKTLTPEQMKQLKGFGPISDIKLRRGEHPFNAWLRQMKQKFGMAPSMLRDKEVMQTLFAAHLGQWDQAQLIGALQQTKWYDTKTKTRVDWLFKYGKADKATALNGTFNQLQEYTRQQFGGVDWTKAGLDESKLKQWAENIASGKTNWDISEAQSRIDELARGIEGTNLWASEESSSENALQETQQWEDIYGQFRNQALDWMGPQAQLSRETLTKWAKRRASGEVTQEDFTEFLQKQRKSLFGYVADDVSMREFLDPYLSQLQRDMGDNASINWEHPLLSNLGAKDANGKLTGDPLSLYDFQLMVRDPELNPGAYQQGTRVYEDGMNNLAQVLQVMRGV